MLGAGSGENALTLRERLLYHPATPWSRGRPFSNLASAMSSAKDLAGRVAVVVGAGSGLGRDLASALTEHGAKVVLAGRTRESLVATLRLLPAVSQSDALVAPTDVSKPEDVDSLHVVDDPQRVCEIVCAFHDEALTTNKDEDEVTPPPRPRHSD